MRFELCSQMGQKKHILSVPAIKSAAEDLND